MDPRGVPIFKTVFLVGKGPNSELEHESKIAQHPQIRRTGAGLRVDLMDLENDFKGNTILEKMLLSVLPLL